ncbi:hypothetical protein DFP72DRAFT_850684 [Ephemerocybe angulata]|uniref:Uncharacterized protein n=1 Tax=Ephemerocybe angulata TaxID=980116 RepID=A0A8H6M129_9AGAR|nr:hypothetical protein DFP72DRAFT_859380 [Tulosesus angulatus]KAF6751563.1 hypothetical protein DFP72DRAFT_850684 [Tulosesus angulatus]
MTPSQRMVLFDSMAVSDLMQLASSSSLLKELTNIYKDMVWRVDDFLATWFYASLKFRCILGFTGAIVSGSQVIRFLDRMEPAISSDLDILTRVGGVLSLVNYLEDEGYTRVQRKPGRKEDYPLLADVCALSSTTQFCKGGGKHGIVEIFDFEKKLGRTLQGVDRLKVQVVVVVQNPIQHILFSYHSTAVMNYICHDETVSIFPKPTFEKRVSYPSTRVDLGDDWNPAWKAKYEARGFRFDLESLDPELILGKRFVKDRYCWVLPHEGE